MKYKSTLLIALSICFQDASIFAQNCPVSFQKEGVIDGSCQALNLTSVHDVMDRPYLYIAAKNGGLLLYDVSNPSSPIALATVPITEFNQLEVMAIEQKDEYLYVALGNHFGTNPQSSGLGIIRIDDPRHPQVSDVWIDEGQTGGGGVVCISGDRAYLGGMINGVFLFDVKDKSNIRLISQYKPSVDYPVANPANAKLYNARGMALRDDLIFLCYDAGGFRVIDYSDPAKPKEIGHYSNPVLHLPINLPRAYNHVVLDGKYAYISVDYCGVEVLDITDPTNPKLTGWWNPYNCPDNNWFTSPSHTNELAFDPDCQTLFVASGKSDLIALDMHDPAHPDSCLSYGGVANGIGTWGLSRYKNQIYLSYICTLGIPFPSNYSGIQILKYAACVSSRIRESSKPLHVLYDHQRHQIRARWPEEWQGKTVQLEIIDVVGRQFLNWSGQVREENTWWVQQLHTPGIYYLVASQGGESLVNKLFIYP